MRNKSRMWILKRLDLVFAFTAILLLFLLFFVLTRDFEDRGPAAVLVAILIAPTFIIGKFIGADTSWRVLKKEVSTIEGLQFKTGKTVRSETYYELPLAMEVPNTYSEFRGGDAVQRLSTRNFPDLYKTSLSGIYHELSEHVFYCRPDDNIEALSLFTPEVLEIITNQKVRCAIETTGSKLRLYSHPSSFLDNAGYSKLKVLASKLQEQINERAGSFNRQQKSFAQMDVRKARKYLTNLTDQAKLSIMATTAIAVLTLTYADNAGSGDIISPALDLPEWLGLSLVSFVLLSPFLIFIVFMNLQRIATTVRKPVSILRVGSTYISRGVVVYTFALLLLFVVLLFASTDTAR